jgi:hypothetical protein
LCKSKKDITKTLKELNEGPKILKTKLRVSKEMNEGLKIQKSQNRDFKGDE